MSKLRTVRIEGEFKRALGEIFLTDLKDPRLSRMMGVTRVDVTQDLKYAKIYVSVLDKSQEKDVLKGLKSAGGFLRRELGSALGLRYTPELIFEADDSIAYGAHILEVMHDVEKADAQRRIDHPESAGETEE